MNIFILDKDTQKCAEYHCNKHVVKMCVETAQLLCTTRHILGDKTPIYYKPTHKNHPVQKWLLKSSFNYWWTLALGFALCREYTYRYEKKHKCEDILKECRDSYFNNKIPNFTTKLDFDQLNYLVFPDLSLSLYERVYNLCSNPVLAMPNKYKIENNAIQSYRNYYALDKFYSIDFRYKNRQIPQWVAEIQNENKKIIQRYKISTST